MATLGEQVRTLELVVIATAAYGMTSGMDDLKKDAETRRQLNERTAVVG